MEAGERRSGEIMAGADSPSSLPGSTRQSIFMRKEMDARVKPAHDKKG
jgi:hypothetical protein